MTRKGYMMRLRKWLVTAVLCGAMTAGMLTGCSGGAGNAGAEATTAKNAEDYSDMIASSDEMIDVDKVVEEGMVPIPGDKVKDGTYEVVLASSSAMFDVTKCNLTVDKGQMTAEMVMSGTGYRYVYPGSPEEAVVADEADYIKPVENKDGKHTFTIPVNALDEGFSCAAFSDRKEKWYARTLLIRADSLPIDAYKEGVLTTVDSLDLEDGEYTADVSMTGGSGRVDIQSPADLKVEDGVCTATIVWDSEFYDYMLVDGEKYEPVNDGGNSAFEIPVKYFDFAMPVVGDTTKMSTPHEIDYALRFDSASIKKK